MANPDVTAILSSLLAGSGQNTYQPPAPVQNPDLASILQSLGGQSSPPAPVPPQQSSIPANLDLGALLSQFQPQQSAPQQRWTSPPPASTRNKREERHREQPERERAAKKRDAGSRIKASRLDDVRESVRTSNADQNMYRALCQFYVLVQCFNEMLTRIRRRIAVGLVTPVPLCIRGICHCMISRWGDSDCICMVLL